MKNKWIWMSLLLLLSLFAFNACSDKQEAKSKKSNLVQKVTGDTAREIVEKAKGPTNRAQKAVQQEENRFKEMEDIQKE